MPDGSAGSSSGQEDATTTVHPDISDPSSSSETPMEAGSLPGINGQDLPGFDEKYSEDLDGLMYLGKLTHEFDWLGHQFVVRTLSADDILAIAQLIQPYAGTVGEQRAYVIATVALAIDTVDGLPLPVPIQVERDSIAWARQRFNYVKSRWFMATIDLVHSEYLVVEHRARVVLEEMGKASGWAPSTLTSSDGSAWLNDVEPLPEDLAV